jgi:hypothetical protein
MASRRRWKALLLVAGVLVLLPSGFDAGIDVSLMAPAAPARPEAPSAAR